MPLPAFVKKRYRVLAFQLHTPLHTKPPHRRWNQKTAPRGKQPEQKIHPYSKRLNQFHAASRQHRCYVKPDRGFCRLRLPTDGKCRPCHQHALRSIRPAYPSGTGANTIPNAYTAPRRLPANRPYRRSGRRRQFFTTDRSRKSAARFCSRMTSAYTR